jgi:hypothetical protein
MVSDYLVVDRKGYIITAYFISSRRKRRGIDGSKN